MGGSALQWRTTLLEDLVPLSFAEVLVSMRKLGPPDVLMAWELLLVEPTGGTHGAKNTGAC